MVHIVYCTFNLETLEFYVGRHSTNNLNDGYQGSGTWVRTQKKSNVELYTMIICEFDTFEKLVKGEQYFIDGLYDIPECKNISKVSSGFNPRKMIGADNPMSNPKHRETVSKRLKEVAAISPDYGFKNKERQQKAQNISVEINRDRMFNNNPMKREEVKLKAKGKIVVLNIITKLFEKISVEEYKLYKNIKYSNINSTIAKEILKGNK